MIRNEKGELYLDTDERNSIDEAIKMMERANRAMARLFNTEEGESDNE